MAKQDSLLVMQGIRSVIEGDNQVFISNQCFIADIRVKQGDNLVVKAGSLVLATEDSLAAGDSLVAGAKEERSLVAVVVDNLAAKEGAVEHSPELDSGIGEGPWISWDYKAGFATGIEDIGAAGFRTRNSGLGLPCTLVEVDRRSLDPAGKDSNQTILVGPWERRTQ